MSSIKEPNNMNTFITIWIGQLVSIVGSGLTGFALGVWIFQQTGKATPFAITVLFGSLPAVLLGPVAGSVADRFNRKKVMLLADTGNALVTFIAFLLLMTGQLEIWNIYLIALVGSIFSAFQEPAFAASIVMLVPRKDLQRANGLTQMTNALGNLVPPLIAGLLFGLIGLQGIILIDFITYFAALGTIIISRIPQPEMVVTEEKSNQWREAMAGWRYLRVNGGLLGLVFYFAVVNFMINFAAVLTSPMVLAVFSPAILGYVQTAGGLGMLIGSLMLSIWGGPKKKILSIMIFITISSLGLALAGLRPNAYLIAAGYFMMLLLIPMASGSSQAIFQTKVPLGLQGRVFAMRSMISRSIMPIAFLSAGPLADFVFEPMMREGGLLANTFLSQIVGVGPGRGIGLIFIIAGLGTVIVTWLAYWNPKIRTIETSIPDVIPELEEDENASVLSRGMLPASE
jgi:MFS family permease